MPFFRSSTQRLFVKRKLQESLDDTAGKAGQQFTRRYINEPGWSEPLRMIASELGTANASSVNAVWTAKASRMLVEMALDTDCVFASELFRLCNVPAKSPCAETLNRRLRFLYQLPDDHFRQFALAGMLESGSERP
jgi:hypothetical protein